MYEGAGKGMARWIVMEIALGSGSRSILDLWGGGQSARMFTENCPDAIVTSAERDPDLWAAMRLDGQQHGYAVHFGDVATCEGRFDLMWLDFCGQVSEAMRSTLKACLPRLSPDGYLALTILPAREGDSLLSGDRLLMIPHWLEGITRRHVRLLYPYKRENGLPMWLVILGPAVGATWFTDELSRVFPSDLLHDDSPLDMVRENIDEHGIWVRPGDTDLFRLTLLHALMPDAFPAESRWGDRPRVVTMTDLTPEQQEIVRALGAMRCAPHVP